MNEGEPAAGDFLIGPSRGHMAAATQDEVHAIAQLAVKPVFHGNEAGQFFLKLAKLTSAIFKLPAVMWIDSAQNGPSHTA
jgi:hypothetical protein